MYIFKGAYILPLSMILQCGVFLFFIFLNFWVEYIQKKNAYIFQLWLIYFDISYLLTLLHGVYLYLFNVQSIFETMTNYLIYYQKYI